MEHVYCLHLLARSHKLYRFVHHGAYAECSTAARVAVELGEHHSVEVEPFVEGLRRIDRVLTGHGVYHEECLVGIELVFQLFNLLHHLLVHCQTAGGIYNHHVVALCLGFPDGIVGYRDNVLVSVLRIDGHSHLCGNDLELVDGSGTVNVARHEQRVLVLLVLEHVGELAAECGLTGTLESRHQHHRWPAAELQLGSLAAHELRQFVVNELHHELSGLHRREHVHAQCLLLYGINESLCHLVVHVGLGQCPADILQRFRHIYLGNLSFTFEYFKRALEPVT